MSKEEIQNKIDSISADRAALERTRNKLTGDIALLLKQITEAKKPKLRHGDWWISHDGRVCVFMKEFNGDCRDCVAISEHIITNIGSDYQDEPILGNIFDLLKDVNNDINLGHRNC